MRIESVQEDQRQVWVLTRRGHGEAKKLLEPKGIRVAVRRKYTTLDELSKIENNLAGMRQSGIVIRGELGHSGTEVTTLDLTPKTPEATVATCVDLSTYERYDTRAKKMIPLPPSQPVRYLMTIHTEKWPTGGIVTDLQQEGVRTCWCDGRRQLLACSWRSALPRRPPGGRAGRRGVQGRGHLRLGVRRGRDALRRLLWLLGLDHSGRHWHQLVRRRLGAAVHVREARPPATAGESAPSHGRCFQVSPVIEPESQGVNERDD
ncbi:hypothetical protein OG259_41095 [Streptomyces sp. NBC_00250]|uniref:hypothetical protein n=1 Tax=Streptomyces sp. NBC_00250 TaxID=2903641 RepID=UPI002E2B0B95|nr:hypothetical protein [Streptomyces sp. NBC_00250]